MDVSNPADPRTVGVSSDMLSYPSDVAAQGMYVICNSLDNHLIIFDVSDPADPTLVIDMSMSVGIEGIAVAGDYIYLACYEAGVMILADWAETLLEMYRRDPGGIMVPVIIVAVFLAFTVMAIASEKRKAREKEIEADLKRDLLDRGMSVEDIERVLNAGAKKELLDRDEDETIDS